MFQAETKRSIKMNLLQFLLLFYLYVIFFKVIFVRNAKAYKRRVTIYKDKLHLSFTVIFVINIIIFVYYTIYIDSNFVNLFLSTSPINKIFNLSTHITLL